MEDCKQKFIKDFEEKISCKLSKEDFEFTINALVLSLKEFDVSEKETKPVPYDDYNTRIVKRYCACLNIDGKSNGTIYQYKRTITRLADFLNKNLNEVGVYDIRFFIANEKSRNISNRTLENTRANISAFFQWMFAEEEIAKNPCINVKPIKYEDKTRLPFSETEIDSIRRSATKSRDRAIVEILLTSGLRVSELVNLKISDIDFTALSVIVRNGKGGKDRITYMSSVAAQYLNSYMKENKIEDGIIFKTKGCKQLHAGGIRFILNSIAKKAEVNNVHPHRFRRTFATKLAKRGMDIQEIKRLLGHSNINTTLEYVYTDDTQVKNSYAKFSA